MKTFWLEFTDGSHGCCQGETEYDAKKIAEHITKKKVSGGEYSEISAKKLPYPANPIIWQLDHPVSGKTPPFCMSPEKCAGHGACPRDYSCTN